LVHISTALSEDHVDVHGSLELNLYAPVLKESTTQLKETQLHMHKTAPDGSATSPHVLSSIVSDADVQEQPA